MNVIDILPYLRRHTAKHHPALPPAHPAFQPVIEAIAEYCAIRGASAAAAICERNWAVFARHYCNMFEDETADVGGHTVTYEELGEFENWLHKRTQELRAAAGERG